MKLSEVSSYISKETAFPAAVTNCLTPQDYQLDDNFELKGGFVKDAQYAWLAYGPNFQVIRTSNCAKVAAWTFGASQRNQKIKITCVNELPCSDGSSRVPHFVIGLALEHDRGMICVFDVRGSKILRAINMPAVVTSLSLVDCGYGGCCPLPQLLSSMNGILAVGLSGGQVLLIDLCHINCDEGLSLETSDFGEICDELHPANLIYINKRERDPQTLEFKRSYAATTGDHLCSALNDEFLSEKVFTLPPRFHDGRNIQRSEVDVTALLYVPQIASLVVGFSFGCFQIWDLTRLVFVYMSPMLQEERQIASLGFQEPCDDPRNFCYLWAVYGNKECNRYFFPFAIMHALCYKTKEWIDAYGFLYQDFLSCNQRFDLDLVGEEGMVGGQIIACHTISKLISSTNQKDGLPNELDESIQEADLTLVLFAWETWGTNNNHSLKMAIFDLNQWYKEQMPGRISQGITSGQVASYMALFSLENAQAKPLLDVSINPESISQFTAVQSLEEHFYPWSLAFDSCSLFADRLTVMNHPGVQRDMLSHLEKSGPACFLQPTETFLQCVSMGLRPVYVDANCLPVWTTAEQREFLLSVALEYQLVGLLSRCATEWADGSQSALGCTLSTFLRWGWKRATLLKSHADTLCIPLYDFSGAILDTNSYKLLDYCGNQLHHLSSLFHGVLKMCRNPIITGIGDISRQAEVLELVATYIEVVEWFINVGLLPECPPNDSDHLNEQEDIGVEMEQLRVPYPVADLAKFYRDRREELKQLHSFSAEKVDILFIDRLVKEECGEGLSLLWEIDGGTGLYPPPSIQSLLRIYLLDRIPMHIKHSIIIYVFLDLSSHFDKTHRYAGTISQFVKFPSAFRLTPSVIKITQALWLLDHRQFLAAIDGLLDPLVSMDDLKPWQHQCIIKAFLYQGQQQLALSYIRVQQPPLRDIEDIRLNLTVLLVNGLVHEAFQFQRQHSTDTNSSDLLNHFFSICERINQLGLILQLPLTPIEEDAFINFLQSCQNSLADDMRIMYYLERSRIAEAMHVNDVIRNRRHKLELNPLKRSRTEDGTNCVRDTIVKAYANTLPSVTKKLAEHCAQQKSTLSNWKQIARPTPMSVEVHRGELQPVQYRSSLLQATLEKARETWSQMIQPPMPLSTLSNQSESDMLETVPFLCTPRAPSEAFCFPREMAPVIFPTLKKLTPKMDEEDFMESYPLKRFRYSENFSSADSPGLPAVKSTEVEVDADASSLLHTPHVRRRTASSLAKEQEMNSVDIFTPQSILKVSKIVQPASPRNIYEESVASGSGSTSDTADDILSKPEIRSTPGMSARQIRFSFPAERSSSRSTSSEGSPEITDRTSKEYWTESRHLRRENSSTRASPEIPNRLSSYKRIEKQSSKTTLAIEEEMEPGIGDMLEEEMNFTLTLSQYYRRHQTLSGEVSAKQHFEIQRSVEEQHDESDTSVCLEDGEETFHSIDSSYHASESLDRSALQKEERKDEPLLENAETAEPIEHRNETSPEVILAGEKTRGSKIKLSLPGTVKSHIVHSASSNEAEDQASDASASDSVCEISGDYEGKKNQLDDSVCIVENYEKCYEESKVLPSAGDELHPSILDLSNTLGVTESKLDCEVYEVKEGREIQESEIITSDGVECFEYDFGTSEMQRKQYEELKPVAISSDIVLERHLEEREQDVIHTVDTDEEGHEVLVHDRQLQEGIYFEEEESTKSEEENLQGITEDDVGYGHEELNENLFEEETPIQELSLSSEVFTTKDEYLGKYCDSEEQRIQENIDRTETPVEHQKISTENSDSVKPVVSKGRNEVTQVSDTSQENSHYINKETMVKPELKGLEFKEESSIHVEASLNNVETTGKQNITETPKTRSIHELQDSKIPENAENNSILVSDDKILEADVDNSSKEVKDDAASSVYHSTFGTLLASTVITDTENQIVKRSAKRASSLQPNVSKVCYNKQKGRASSVEPRLHSYTHIKTEAQANDENDLIHSGHSQTDTQEIIPDKLQKGIKYSKRRASSVQPSGICQEEKNRQRRRSSRRSSSLAPESIGSSQTSSIDAWEMKLFTKTAILQPESNQEINMKADSIHNAESITQDSENNKQEAIDAASKTKEALTEGTDALSYNSAPKRKRRSSSLQPEHVYIAQAAETVILARKSRRSSSLQPETLGSNKTKNEHLLENINKELKGSTEVKNEISYSGETHLKHKKKNDFLSESGISGSSKSGELTFEKQRLTRSRRSGSLQPEILLVTHEIESKETNIHSRRSRSLQPESPLELQETDKKAQVKPEVESIHSGNVVSVRRSARFIPSSDSENRNKRSNSLQPDELLVMQVDEIKSKGKESKRRRSRSLSLQPQEMDSKMKVKIEEESAHSSENLSTRRRSRRFVTDNESLKESLVPEMREETEEHAIDSTLNEDELSSVSSDASTIKREDFQIHQVKRKKRVSSADSSVSTVKYEEPLSPEKEKVAEKTKSDKVIGDMEILQEKVSDYTEKVTEHLMYGSSKARSVHGDSFTGKENSDIKRYRRSRSVPSGVIINLRAGDDAESLSSAPLTSKEGSLPEQESKISEGASSRNEMEEYTTARRLTRHQRSLLQRSLELAKGSQSFRERKIPKLPPVPESSDQEDADSETLSQASSTATRSSARLQSQKTLSLSSAQVSPKQESHDENKHRRSAKQKRLSSSASVDTALRHHPEDSPHSNKSEDSAFTSSVNRSSPLSTRSEEPSAGRLRRRSLRSVLRSIGSDTEMRDRRSNTQLSDSSDESSVASSVVSSRSSLRGKMSQGTSLQEGDIRRSNRISQIQEENARSQPFEFSPPAVVSDKLKKDVLSTVPEFIFSPPGKTQEIIKGQNASHPVRAHKMTLRGLHTIAEESISSIPSTSPADSQGKSKKKSPKKAKRLKTVEDSEKTTERGQEKEATERERSSSRPGPKKSRHYDVFKQRKIFYLRKRKAKKQ